MSKIPTLDAHVVRRYHDAKAIGTCPSEAQYKRYMTMAQQPEGLIRLGAMPHDMYDLDEEYQDTHEDTTVYID